MLCCHFVRCTNNGHYFKVTHFYIWPLKCLLILDNFFFFSNSSIIWSRRDPHLLQFKCTKSKLENQVRVYGQHFSFFLLPRTEWMTYLTSVGWKRNSMTFVLEVQTEWLTTKREKARILPHKRHTDRSMKQQIDNMVGDWVHWAQQVIHSECEYTQRSVGLVTILLQPRK